MRKPASQRVVPFASVKVFTSSHNLVDVRHRVNHQSDTAHPTRCKIVDRNESKPIRPLALDKFQSMPEDYRRRGLRCPQAIRLACCQANEVFSSPWCAILFGCQTLLRFLIGIGIRSRFGVELAIARVQHHFLRSRMLPTPMVSRRWKPRRALCAWRHVDLARTKQRRSFRKVRNRYGGHWHVLPVFRGVVFAARWCVPEHAGFTSLAERGRRKFHVWHDHVTGVVDCRATISFAVTFSLITSVPAVTTARSYVPSSFFFTTTAGSFVVDVYTV